MEKIKSFTINHKLLNPGIYVSRVDRVGRNSVTTFDIRMKKPNVDEPMDISAMHTIEHIGATYLRNNKEWKDKVIYFGPMGCQTGFYLVMSGTYPLYRKAHKCIINLIIDMFRFIVDFKDKKHIPGATAEECGNYKSQNLDMAHTYCADMLVRYGDFMLLEYEYPTGNPALDKEAHIRQELFINRPNDRVNAKKAGLEVTVPTVKTATDAVYLRYEDDREKKVTKDVVVVKTEGLFDSSILF